MSVGISAGLLSLAPEGLSFASLRGMPDATGAAGENAEQEDDAEPEDEHEFDEEPEPVRARAGVSG